MKRSKQVRNALIIQLWSDLGLSQYEVARTFGISQPAVNAVIKDYLDSKGLPSA